MKPIFIMIAPIALLAACDRPMQDIELRCFDLDIHARVYPDYALLDITNNGSWTTNEYKAKIPVPLRTAKNMRVIADTHQEEVSKGSARIKYAGAIGDTQEVIILTFSYFPEKKSGYQYGLEFNNDSSFGPLCQILIPYQLKNDPMKPARVSKKERARIQECVQYIYDNATVYSDQYDNVVEFELKTPRGPMPITQKQALELSKNWDFYNMWLYTNADNELYEYEADACDVMDRMKTLIGQ